MGMGGQVVTVITMHRYIRTIRSMHDALQYFGRLCIIPNNPEHSHPFWCSCRTRTNIAHHHPSRNRSLTVFTFYHGTHSPGA